MGAPGSGKTCLLLQLVLKLLESERFAIPVILNLATWQSSYITLTYWLEEILPLELGVNRTFAKKIIQQSNLILLFDGFDEVHKNDRTSCLEAIGRYGVDANRKFVITSRIEEYKAVVRDAPVNFQIDVGPLTLEQIIRELDKIGYKQPEPKRLSLAIKNDDLIQELVENPFYFNLLQLLFAQGMLLSDLKFSSNGIEDLQKDVVQEFINNQLISSDKNNYQPEGAQKWLAFLAHRMGQRNLVVFELRDLQYDWWNWSRWDRFLGGFIGGLGYNIMGGLILSLAAGLIVGLGYSLGNGLYYGLGIGLIAGMFAGLSTSLGLGLVGGLTKHPTIKIETRDRIHYTWKLYWKYLRENLIPGLVYSLITSLTTALIVGLIYDLITGLVTGLVAGLIFILLLGLIDIRNEVYSTFLQINRPYQRFYASMYRLHFSILQHWLLRYQLYHQGLLPLKLVRFLNEMTRRHILESDGATWRFRHRLIQEYFAGMWEEAYETKKWNSNLQDN